VLCALRTNNKSKSWHFPLYVWLNRIITHRMSKPFDRLTTKISSRFFLYINIQEQNTSATVTNHNQCRMSVTVCTSTDLHYTCTHLCVLRVYEMLLVSHLAVRSTVRTSTSRTASNWITSLISCINESESVLSRDDPRAYKAEKSDVTRTWKQQQNLRIVTALCLLRYLIPYLQN